MRTQAAALPTSTPGPRERLLTPAFALAWLVNVSGFLVFYILVTTMALYAVTQFAASDALGGLASSSFIIGATVARLFAGFLVDTFGRRRILWIALIVVAGVCGLYLVAPSVGGLIAVRAAHGAGYAFASTAIMAVAQTAIPAHRRAEGTGYFALGTTLATAIGPALGLFLVNAFDYSALFAVTWAIAAVGLVLGLFLRIDEPARSAERERFSLRHIAHPAVLPLGAFMLVVGLCYSGVITYLSSYALQQDVAVGAGMFFLAYAAVTLVMRFVLGRVQDRRGDNVVMYLGLASFALALGLLAIATADWQIVLAGALTGLGWGTLMPAAQAIAVNLVPANKLGTGISTMLLLMDVGFGIGPVVLGVLASAAGFDVMYGFLAGLVVLGAVLYHAVHGRRDVAKGRRTSD